MIKSLRMINFKSFTDESLHVGPFTLIVGANASGKSNIRDAFRFLHGIGRGYTLAEIVGGKYGTDWKPIRGSAGGISRFQDATKSPSFALEARMSMGSDISADTELEDATYRIEALLDAFRGQLQIISESLKIDLKDGWETLVSNGWNVSADRFFPALHQNSRSPIDYDEYDVTRKVNDAFYYARFFDLVPDRMRELGSPGQVRLGDGGESLPVALQSICKDPERKSALTRIFHECS